VQIVYSEADYRNKGALGKGAKDVLDKGALDRLQERGCLVEPQLDIMSEDRIIRGP